VLFENLEEVTNIVARGLKTYAELPVQVLSDGFFRVTGSKKFEHPRSDEVQPVHLPVQNIEDHASLLVMREADIF